MLSAVSRYDIRGTWMNACVTDSRSLPKMTEFYVKVHPDSEDFRVEEDLIPEVYLTSRAENGRANRELRDRFSEILDADVGIISGAKSRRKKLKTELSEEELRERLSSSP